MVKRRKERVGKRRRGRLARPARPKLDPRLAFLLSLSEKRRQRLKADEDLKIRSVARWLEEAVTRYDRATGEARERAMNRLREADRQLFAPLTTGLFIPGQSPREISRSVRLKEPFVSAFILSDASADDLKRLGVRVRSKIGDVFTAFIPLSAINKLEASPAIRFVELARPLFPALDYAVHFTQIDTLHGATPPFDGAGVIVGVIDNALDIYHPDFRTAANTTRALYLWDQTLTPQGTEAGPPVGSALPGFVPAGGITYGVEYDRTAIDNELNSFNPPATPAYQTIRHGGAIGAHGTHVAGIAAGNGRGQGGTYAGAAPAADIIFVAYPNLFDTGLLADSTFVNDAFAYIFARAAQLGRACVVNMSVSDNQGPHDGTAAGEQAIDAHLLTPGRAITLSAGNLNSFAAHAAGTVPAGGAATFRLKYLAGAGNSDAIEIWYDGCDRFDVAVTVPTAASVIGPIAAGSTGFVVLPNGIRVDVTSIVNDGRNGDNLISIIFTVPVGKTIPAGDTIIALFGATVVNGAFQAWVDRNNVGLSAFQPPHVKQDQLTLGVPATARRAITVGNHDKRMPPRIDGSSGCGPTRDGRIKPEIATVGSGGLEDVVAPRSRNMNAADPGALYMGKRGTSMSAPLVGGVCALLFQCRGSTATWANLKQVLADSAVPAMSGNAFGYGYMQVSMACAAPPPVVDVWLRDDAGDTGAEPFTGPVAWLSPDIDVLDTAGNPVPNPTYDSVNGYNNIIRVTVRNRGTQIARNTEVYLYWADPATNLSFPSAWNRTGICTGSPNFTTQGNMIIIPQVPAAANRTVDFGWGPPAAGSNIRGDDHFCLLVQVENESDPSQIGAGGWSAIGARNNIAMRNVHVQPDDAGDSVMAFYVVGSADQDSLTIYQDLAGGTVDLMLPVQALPWRDIRLIERNNGARPAFGENRGSDPLVSTKAVLEGDKTNSFTDIVGAERLMLRDGVATVTIASRGPLHLPCLRIADGARMTARIQVRRPKTHEQHRYVHIAQHSGGQLVGGVSLELRPGIKRGANVER